MNFRRLTCAILILASLLTLLPFAAMAESLSGESGTAAVTGAGVSISRTSLSLVRGESMKLTVNSSKTKTWSSSRKSVATVSSKGVVKAVGYGTTTITCKLSDGTKLKCTVKVSKAVTFKKPLKGIRDFDGKWSIDFKNNSSTKTIKKIWFYRNEYNKSGKLLKKSLLYLDRMITSKPDNRMRIGPGKNFAPPYNVIWIEKSQKSTYKMTFSVYKVAYTDGTTWTP